jgi:hypothetical protein
MVRDKFVTTDWRSHAHCESKKGPLYFCPYLSQILTEFQNFFNIEITIKYTTKQLLYLTTNPERVTTVSDEIINCTNDVIFIDDRRQYLQ